MMKNNVFNRLSIILSCSLILLSSFSVQAEDNSQQNNIEKQQINKGIPKDQITWLCPNPNSSGGISNPGQC